MYVCVCVRTHCSCIKAAGVEQSMRLSVTSPCVCSQKLKWSRYFPLSARPQETHPPQYTHTHTRIVCSHFFPYQQISVCMQPCCTHRPANMHTGKTRSGVLLLAFVQTWRESLLLASVCCALVHGFTFGVNVSVYVLPVCSCVTIHVFFFLLWVCCMCCVRDGICVW